MIFGNYAVRCALTIGIFTYDLFTFLTTSCLGDQFAWSLFLKIFSICIVLISAMQWQHFWRTNFPTPIHRCFRCLAKVLCSQIGSLFSVHCLGKLGKLFKSAGPRSLAFFFSLLPWCFWQQNLYGHALPIGSTKQRNSYFWAGAVLRRSAISFSLAQNCFMFSSFRHIVWWTIKHHLVDNYSY